MSGGYAQTANIVTKESSSDADFVIILRHKMAENRVRDKTQRKLIAQLKTANVSCIRTALGNYHTLFNIH